MTVHAMTPPATGPASGTVYVNRMVHRAFHRDGEFLRAPRHRANVRVYLSDLLRPYGLTLDEERFEAGTGQSYGEMAVELIEAVVDEPVDVLVLAFAVPDVWPGRATATYLSHVCPGAPLAFAVCDQGTAGAYTGLRLVRDYLLSGAARRALLLTVEQSTVHYDPPGAAPIPTGAAGVAVLCALAPTGPDARRLDSVSVRPHATPTDLADPPPGATLIAGAGLDQARAGQPYTGAWAGLAATTTTTAATGTVVLADYDPALRYLCTATFTRGSSA